MKSYKKILASAGIFAAGFLSGAMLHSYPLDLISDLSANISILERRLGPDYKTSSPIYPRSLVQQCDANNSVFAELYSIDGEQVLAYFLNDEALPFALNPCNEEGIYFDRNGNGVMDSKARIGLKPVGDSPCDLARNLGKIKSSL